MAGSSPAMTKNPKIDDAPALTTPNAIRAGSFLRKIRNGIKLSPMTNSAFPQAEVVGPRFERSGATRRAEEKTFPLQAT
jgi:hypothetical protein